MNKQFLYKKKYLIAGGIALVVAVSAALFSYSALFGAPQKDAELEQFTIPTTTAEDHDKKIIDDASEIADLLKEKGFIKSALGFRIAFAKGIGLGILPTKCVDCIQEGAYKISKSMNAWEVADILKGTPYMKWVVIPEGYRKEQIAELMAEAFGWNQETKQKWIVDHASTDYDHLEGVFFPDTYLIPTEETPFQMADRLRARFNEKFQPYAEEALKQNIKWTTVLKLASIVQREAAGKEDMPLIAGILWNRLLADMRLETDATIQYIRDDVLHYGRARYDAQLLDNYTSEGGWWEPINPEDKNIESPYNTYRNKGLPPHPIANPGVDAIEAVLYPEETDCLFYLHDSQQIIHCAETYEQHQTNIESYLKAN